MISHYIYWVVVSNIFYFQPYLGKWSNLTNIFQLRWNHQLVYIYMNPRKDMWHENKFNPWKIWKDINIDQHKPQGFAVVGPLKSGQARHIVDFRDGSWYREDVYDFLRYPGWRLKVWKVSMGFFHGTMRWTFDGLTTLLFLGRRFNLNIFFCTKTELTSLLVLVVISNDEVVALGLSLTPGANPKLQA